MKRRGRTVSSTAIGGKTTDREVESAKADYRRLVIAQRKLPLEEQWTMGPAIRHAKARALMLIEALRLGQ